MALAFVGDSSDRVNFGRGAAIDTLTEFTICFWAFLGTYAQPLSLFSKGLGRKFRLDTERTPGAGNSAILQVTRTPDNTQSWANDNPFDANNTWYFIAAGFKDSDSPKISIHTAKLGQIVAPRGIGETPGSGTINDDSADDLYCGQAENAADAWPGRIAWFHYAAKKLSTAELRRMQYRPQPIAESRIFCWLDGPAQNQANWAGNGLDGTVVGCTQGAGVPLPPPLAGLRDLAFDGSFPVPLVASSNVTRVGMASGGGL